MKEKKEMLITYMEANVAPILVDFMTGEDFPEAVVIPADIPQSELSCHYEGGKYVTPKWYNKLISPGSKKILVIDKIDEIKLKEQLKFIDILKYHQVSTYSLPKDSRIIVTASQVNKDTVCEEIFSLVAKI
jgi:hypothetical protein